MPSLDAHWPIAAVFAVVYVGMFLGGLPTLKLDRSGIALLGAIAVIPLIGSSVEDAARAVDLPTLVLLFAFMVLAAQMRLGGFYTEVLRRGLSPKLSPRGLLAVLLLVAALLSAVFSNDVICLALTPLVARLALRRSLPPLPFLVGLACASNIGSGLTLIGNPQNMLIGSMLKLPFGAYLQVAALPVGLSLLLLWAWLARSLPARKAIDPIAVTAVTAASAAPSARADEPPFDLWQSIKGLGVAVALMVVFLFTGWPRELAALVGAGVLLMSRRLHSAEVMGFVDWPLLLLFIGLFVVNHAFAQTGYAAQAVAWLQVQGLALERPAVLAGVTVLLSNLVSNVPAVMLLLPHLGSDPQQAGTQLALVSTFACTLLLVGSIANLIVADLAAREGITLDWKRHALTGLPVTLLSLGLVWLFA